MSGMVLRAIAKGCSVKLNSINNNGAPLLHDALIYYAGVALSKMACALSFHDSSFAKMDTAL